MSEAGPTRISMSACASDMGFAEALATALRAVGRAGEAEEVEACARVREE